MKTALYCLFFSLPLLYYPLYPSEEFETPKAYVFIAFTCFSFLFVRWKKVLFEPIGQTLLAFLASAGLSTLWSIDWHMSVFGNPKLNNGLLIWISYVSLYGALLQSLRKYSEKLILIKIIIASAFLVSVYAIAQVLGYDFKSWFGVLYEYGYLRPMSTLGHPNFMAAYVAMILPFVLWSFDQAKTKGEKGAYAFIGFCLSLSLLFSQSRGMWWAALFGVLIYYLMVKASMRRFLTLLVSIITLLGCCAVLSKPFRQGAFERLTLVTSIGIDRKEYYKGAYRIWRSHPLLGSGLDTYELAFQHQRTQQYWDIQANGSPHRAHNEFLNILATQGLLGAFIGFLFTLVLIRSVQNSISTFLAPTTASLVVFYIQELSSFHVIATGTLFIVCLILLKPRNEWIIQKLKMK